RLTTALGTGAVMLYQRDSGPDIAVVSAATPIVVLGPRLTTTTVPSREVRALLAHAVELTRPEHIAFAGLTFEDASRLVASVARLFGPPILREAAINLVDDLDLQRGHDEMVKAALSVRIRTRLEQLLLPLAPFQLDPARYLAACHRTADRAALLLDGDPLTIARGCTARGEGTAHLVAAVAQPGWQPLRAKLGIGPR
ncbi:MAG TPA: hypothetical protein VIU61_24435, partial [Kofleriaceae bacterium]